MVVRGSFGGLGSCIHQSQHNTSIASLLRKNRSGVRSGREDSGSVVGDDVLAVRKELESRSARDNLVLDGMSTEGEAL